MSDHDVVGPQRRPAAREWVMWLGAITLLTAAMLAARASLDKAHLALAYLLAVLGASARAGRAVGLTVSVVAFFVLNFFFLPPYHTLAVADPRDWLVLFAFLVTSATAAHLLSRARAEAAEAQQRAHEIDRLAAVGAEALNAGRADEALVAVADVIRRTLRVDRCELYEQAPANGETLLVAAAGEEQVAAAPRESAPETRADEFMMPTGLPLVRWVATTGRVALELEHGSVHVAGDVPVEEALRDMTGRPGRAMLVPLRVAERIVGVLRLADDAAWMLDPARRRILEALSYYAALGVERVRLVAEAEHADALREADTLKDALLASVSHDLRTPLTTIKALAHDIRLEGDERAAIIEEEADRLNRFVADLLDLSRIAGGALVVSPEITAVEDLLGAALQRISGAAAGRRVDVQLDGGEPLLLARFDFVHTLRVLVNLIENALKYAPEGVVEITAHRAGDVVEIAVADRGPGIAPAERNRVFEPFYRPASAAAGAAGAGLGLSIARSFAEAQGGGVRYEPRAGGGSRLVVTLPAVDVAELPGTAGAAGESL